MNLNARRFAAALCLPSLLLLSSCPEPPPADAGPAEDAGRANETDAGDPAGDAAACFPCAEDTDCSDDGACVDVGGADHCARLCDDDEDCPQGTTCRPRSGAGGEDIRVCVPDDDVCTCSAEAVAAGTEQSCRAADDDACLGTRRCVDDDGTPALSSCEPLARDACVAAVCPNPDLPVCHLVDAGVDDAGASDAGAPDAGQADAGPDDGGVDDGGVDDGGVDDGGVDDGGVDDGGVDGGANDAGVPACRFFVEVCDGVDNNCNDAVDEGCDDDNDGFCALGAVVLPGATCAPGDCADGDNSRHPGATEGVGDGVDQDCNGLELCFTDGDRDGARSDVSGAQQVASCNRADGWALASAPLDCDDDNPARHPDAEERVGNGLDGDCDGFEVCYVDSDDDGARSNQPSTPTNDISCSGAFLALASAAPDCADDDATRHPGAADPVGDGIDQDCDESTFCYVDADGDGHRTDVLVFPVGGACNTADGLATADAPVDCNDRNALAHVGATEISDDGVDSDCDGIELFDGVPMTVHGSLDEAFFNVAVSGAFPLPFVDDGAVVSGSIRREGDGAPVQWCISAPVVFDWANASWGGGTVEVCHQASTTDLRARLQGQVVQHGLTFAVAGQADRIAPFSAELNVEGDVDIRGVAAKALPAAVDAHFSIAAGVLDGDVRLSAPVLPVDGPFQVRNAVVLVDDVGLYLQQGQTVLQNHDGSKTLTFSTSGDVTAASNGPVDLVVRTFSAVAPFTEAQLPQHFTLLGAAGSLTKGDAGPAVFTASGDATCRGDCCDEHVWGGCDDPTFEACVVDQLPECAFEWSDACVDALAGCDLELADGHRLKSPTVTFDAVADDDAVWQPVLRGTPRTSVAGSSFFPEHTVHSRVDTCASRGMRECVIDVDSSCALHWTPACTALVDSDCGGVAGVDECRVGALFLQSDFPARIDVSDGVVPDGLVVLRDLAVDTVFHHLGSPVDPVDRPEGYTFTGALEGDVALCFDTQCPESFYDEAVVGDVDATHGGYVVGVTGRADNHLTYMSGQILNFHLPPFEASPKTAVVFSASPLPKEGSGFFDVFHTPDDAGDDVRLPLGMSLVTSSKAGFAIPDFTADGAEPMWNAVFAVAGTELNISGTARFNWRVIPRDTIPSVDWLDLSYIRAYGALSMGSLVSSNAAGGTGANAMQNPANAPTQNDDGLTFGVEGVVEFKPANQDDTLFGAMNLEFKPADAAIAGGNVWLEGTWLEPFFLRDIAFQGLGSTLYLNVATGVPIAFGSMQNYFFRPDGCEWPDTQLDWWMGNTCLAQGSFGLFFEPKADVLAYGRTANIDLNTGIAAMNAFATSISRVGAFAVVHSGDPDFTWNDLYSQMGEPTPEGGPPPELDNPVNFPQIPTVDGFDLVIDDAQFYLAPKQFHRWGRSFMPGARFNFLGTADGTFSAGVSGQVKMSGMQATGVAFNGFIDPMPYGDVQLVADPYRTYVELHGDTITIPHDDVLTPTPTFDALGTATSRTVEAYVYEEVFAVDDVIVLYEKADGDNGLVVTLVNRSEEGVADPGSAYPDIDTGDAGVTQDDVGGPPTDSGADKAWIVVTVKNGGLTRTYRTHNGVVEPGVWQHVAVAVRNDKAYAKVGNAPVPLTAEGDAVVLGATDADVVIGAGLDRIDEFRLWRTFRSLDELNAFDRVLGVGNTQGVDLLVRLPFDYDDLDGVVTHNAKTYDMGAPLHGRFDTFAARFVVDPEGRSFVFYDVDWSDRQNITAKVGLQAGASFQVPGLQTPWSARTWVHLDSTAAAGAGEFYAREMHLMHLNGLGDLWLSGNGPNFIPDDHDDGVYGAFDVDPMVLTATSRLDWSPSAGDDVTIATSDLYVGCPRMTSCPTPANHVFEASGTLNLPLSESPQLRLYGDFDANTSRLHVAGGVEAFGVTMTSSSIEVDSVGATYFTQVDLPVVFDQDLGDASLLIDVVFEPLTVCGSGTVRAFNPAGTEDFECSVDVCIDDAGVRVDTIDCFDRCYADAMCGTDEFCDLLGNCWPKRPLGDACAGVLVGDHECLSGFCDPWVAFPAAVCAEQLNDGIGCLQDGQCISGNCGARLYPPQQVCFTPGSSVVGDECVDDAQCGQGQCWGSPTYSSHCFCVDDADCANSGMPGTVCKRGDWGITPLSGTCVPPRQEGEACFATPDCDAGLACADGACRLPDSKNMYELCNHTVECKGGACWGTVGFDARCMCDDNADCAAGGPAGSVCDLGNWAVDPGAGNCMAPMGEDGYCWETSECATGLTCRGNGCRGTSTKAIGATCHDNAQCMSGECWNGTCLCANNAECEAGGHPGQVCDIGAWGIDPGSGTCKAPVGLNQDCGATSECAGGRVCGEHVDAFIGTQCVDGGLAHDAPCFNHGQCGTEVDALVCTWWPFGPGGIGAGFYCGY